MAKFGRGDEAVVVTVEDLRSKDNPLAWRSCLELRYTSVSHLESLADLLLRVSILHLAGHHGEELYLPVSIRTRSSVISGCRTWEVNGAVVVGINLVDHVLKLRLRRVLAKRAHDSTELLGGNLS